MALWENLLSPYNEQTTHVKTTYGWRVWRGCSKKEIELNTWGGPIWVWLNLVPKTVPCFMKKKKPYGQDWTCLTFTKHTSSNTLVVSLFTEDCLKVILPMKENCVLVWRIEAKKNQYGCLSSLCPKSSKTAFEFSTWLDIRLESIWNPPCLVGCCVSLSFTFCLLTSSKVYEKRCDHHVKLHIKM